MRYLNTARIKKCVLYGQLFVIFTAFASLYPQIHGLFGERGLVPVAPMLECEEESIFECRLPLLRVVCNVLQLSPAVGLQAFCLVGLFLSSFAIMNPIFQKLPTFVILYFLYRTIYEAGGVFMYYQWDAFLLESTIYVAVLAWFDDGPADSLAMYGIIVLLVRATFMTGATKLLSKCPAYWNLTALNFQFESQPLPNYFSWHAHHLPSIVKQFASLIIHYIEIVLPALFLIPVIHVRFFVYLCHVLLVTLNLLTGNGGFFNYNVLVLLISLLETPRTPVGASFLSAIIFSKLGYDIAHRTPIKIILGENKSLELVFTLTQETFRKFVVYYIDMFIILMGVMFCIMTYTIIRNRTRGALRTTLHYGFVALSFLLLNVYGLVPLIRMDEKMSERTLDNPFVMSYFKGISGWSIANSYGSYRQMTGLYGRPEIIIEGASQIEGPWKEIPFRAKPGDVSRGLEFPTPNHPRLDLQMHYAAEGTYQQNPFFLSLVYHLMQNTTEVVGLMGKYPFQNRSEPMNFARAKLYMYHFTGKGAKDWWTRDFQEEYMPTFNKGNEALTKYLVDHRIINKKKSSLTNGPLGNFLRRWHRYSSGIDAVVFVFTLVFVVVGKTVLDYCFPDSIPPPIANFVEELENPEENQVEAEAGDEEPDDENDEVETGDDGTDEEEELEPAYDLD